MGKEDQGGDGPEGGGGICTDLGVWVDSWQKNRREVLRTIMTGEGLNGAVFLLGQHGWSVT